MMRVSHNPPSFLPPYVLALLPALAGSARALGILGADAGHRPFTLCFREAQGCRGLGRIRSFTSCNPMTQGAHTQICSVAHKQLHFTWREGDECFEQMMH